MLDSISHILSIECCWIQTIRDRKKQQLSLAAGRGFSEKMRSEIVSMDLNHELSGQVIGMGNKIIIPDLNNDGAYGLASFRESGYKWLVAVPLMTYRAWGLLGTASKNKKILEKDTAEFVMVIAGLIASALSKSHLAGSFIRHGKLPEIVAMQPDKTPALSDTVTEVAPATPAVNAQTPDAAESLLVISSSAVPDVNPAPPVAEGIDPVMPPPAVPPVTPAAEERPPEVAVEKKAVEEIKPRKKVDPVFHTHTRKMESFRKAHK